MCHMFIVWSQLGHYPWLYHTCKWNEMKRKNSVNFFSVSRFRNRRRKSALVSLLFWPGNRWMWISPPFADITAIDNNKQTKGLRLKWQIQILWGISKKNSLNYAFLTGVLLVNTKYQSEWNKQTHNLNKKLILKITNFSITL